MVTESGQFGPFEILNVRACWGETKIPLDSLSIYGKPEINLGKILEND